MPTLSDTDHSYIRPGSPINARFLVLLFILLVLPIVVYLVFQRQIFRPGAAPGEVRSTTFSAPTLVNTSSADLQISPAITVTEDDTVHALWADNRDGFGQFDIFTSQSDDGGVTWGDEQDLTEVPLGKRGSAASIASSGNQVRAVWGGPEGLESAASSGDTWSSAIRLEESVPTVSSIEIEARSFLPCIGNACPQLQLYYDGQSVGLPVNIDGQTFDWYSFDVPEGALPGDSYDFIFNPNGKNLSVRNLRLDSVTTDQGIFDNGVVADGTAFDCVDTAALIDDVGRVHKSKESASLRFNHNCVDLPGYAPPEDEVPEPHYVWSPHITSHEGIWYIVAYEEYIGETYAGKVVLWSGNGESWIKEVVAELPPFSTSPFQVLPKVAVDDDLHVVWTDGDVQYISRSLTGGVWSSPVEPLNTAGENQWEPQVIAYDGLVGILTSTNSDIYYLVSEGADFASSQVLPASVQAVSTPVITHTDGVLQVVWSSIMESGQTNRLSFIESIDDGATWSESTEVEVGGTEAQFAPAIAVDSTGVLHVSYQNDSIDDSDVFHTRGITTNVPVVEPVPDYGSVQFSASKGQSSVPPLVKVRVDGEYVLEANGDELILEIESEVLKSYTAPVGPAGVRADSLIDLIFINPSVVENADGTVNEPASTLMFVDAIVIDTAPRLQTLIQPEVIDDPRQAVMYTYGADEESALNGNQWLTAGSEMVCSTSTPSFGLGDSCNSDVVTLDTQTNSTVGALRINYPSRLSCEVEGDGGVCALRFNDDGENDEGCTALADVCEPPQGDLPDLNATGISVYKHPTDHNPATELSLEDIRTYLTNGNDTNDRVWFRARLSNTGSATVEGSSTNGAFFTHWLFDGVADSDLHDPMDANSFSTRLPAIVKERTLIPGNHNVKFVADRLPNGVYEGTIEETNENDNEFPPDSFFSYTVDEPAGVIGPETLVITAKGRANFQGLTPPRMKVLVDGVVAPTVLNDVEQQVKDDAVNYSQYIYNVPGITLDSTIDILALNVGATIDGAGVDEWLSTILYIDSVEIIDAQGNRSLIQPELEPAPVEDPPMFDEGDNEVEMLDDIELDYPHQMVCSAATPVRGAAICDDFAVTIMKKGALRLNYDSQVLCEVDSGSTGGYCTFKFNQAGANDEGCTTIGAACSKVVVHPPPTVCEADPLAPDVGQCVPLYLASVPGGSCTSADDCPLVIIPPASVCETDPSDPEVGQCVVNGTASQPGNACTSIADCSGVVTGKADLDVQDIRVYESYNSVSNTLGAEIPEANLGSYIGQTVYFAADMQNTGGTSATGPFKNKWIMAAAPSSPLSGLVETVSHKDTLLAGAYSNDDSRVNDWRVREGSFVFTFEADSAGLSGDAIDEDNDQFAGINNNVLQKQFTISPQGGLRTVCDLGTSPVACVPIDQVITPGPDCPAIGGDDFCASLSNGTPDLNVVDLRFFESYSVTTGEYGTEIPEEQLGSYLGQEISLGVTLRNDGDASTATPFMSQWTVGEFQDGSIPGIIQTVEHQDLILAGEASTHRSNAVSWTVVEGDLAFTYEADIPTLSAQEAIPEDNDQHGGVNNNVLRKDVSISAGSEGGCDLPDGLCIRAKAEIDSLNPEAPIFELMIDGNYVIDFGGPGYTVRTAVPNTDWVVYKFTQADLGRVVTDTSRVSVAYLNDKYDGKASLDRNLVIDWIEVAGNRIEAEDSLYDIGRYTHDHRVRKLPGYHNQGRDCTQVVPGQQRMTVQGMLRFNDTTCLSGIYDYNPGDIRGRVFIDENKDGVFDDAEEMTSPRGDVTVRLDYHMGTFAHGFLSPYFFTDTFTDRRHQVDIDVPAGWQVKYRLCTNDFKCHTEPTHPEYNNLRTGRTALVTMPTENGAGLDKPYLDIYWFVTPN